MVGDEIFLEESWVLEDAVASLVERILDLVLALALAPDLFLALALDLVLALALASDLVPALALASAVEPIPSLVYPSLCF